jgi:hypothetical protein
VPTTAPSACVFLFCLERISNPLVFQLHCCIAVYILKGFHLAGQFTILLASYKQFYGMSWLATLHTCQKVKFARILTGWNSL